MIERRIIIGLVTSTNYIRQIENIWDTQLLESSTARMLAGWVWEYYGKYHKAPNREIENIYYQKLKEGLNKEIGEEIETKVELHGQRPWIWKATGGDWNMLVLTGSEKSPGKKTPPDKYILEPLLFWMFCLSINDGRGRIGDSNITFHIVYKEDVKIWTYRIGESEANEYLTRLVSDYLNQKKMEWLPFEEVTSQSIAPHKLRDDEISEDKKARFQTELQEVYGETASYLIKLANPCLPDMAFDKVRGRFRVFFEFLDGE